MKRKKKLTLLQKRKMTGLLFILPWFIGFLIFYVRSILMAGGFAFSELNMDAVNGGYKLTNIGFENFRYALRVHGSFKQILTTSVLDMLVDVPLITFFSLFMAILLNKKFRGRTIVRAIFFLPIIMNSAAITSAMELSAQMMQGGISSVAAEMLSTATAAGNTLALDIDYFIDMFMNLGLPVTFIGYIITAVARINDIISASGVQIIIFIAALQSIPGSMYEVAKIEGATGYETFWKVIFPMVMPHIITNVVYTIVDSFTESGVVDLAYKTAFNEFNYGLSSVFSLMSTLITCIILVTVCGLIQKRTFYYN